MAAVLTPAVATEHQVLPSQIDIFAHTAKAQREALDSLTPARAFVVRAL